MHQYDIESANRYFESLAGRMQAIMKNPEAYNPISAEKNVDQVHASRAEVTHQVTYATTRLREGATLMDAAAELEVDYKILRSRMDGRKIKWRAICHTKTTTWDPK
tara:strand:+ start:5856 stop:6173 length:318 start_codon:yes stop_codon:yes gene_type:complete